MINYLNKTPDASGQQKDVTRFFPAYLIFLVLATGIAQAQTDPQTRHYQDVLRPVMVEHCFSCHNGGDKKAGLNLEDVYFAISIINNGATWVKVIEQIRSGEMPPHTKPRIPEDEKNLLVEGLETLLDSALSIPDPGEAVMRRLSNREYRYTVLDLTGIDFDAQSYFPADPSAGEGFDNHGRALYITPLQMERYFQAADSIINRLYADEALWREIAPATFDPGLLESLAISWQTFWSNTDGELDAAQQHAATILFPFATRAYRRFLSQEEKVQLLKVFAEVYAHVRTQPTGFDTALQEAMKYLLVSPSFLYRREANVLSRQPFQITNLELASRLSYFLWSSAPDQELLDLAYRENLHNPELLRQQLERMLNDPRSRRMAESVAGQWFEAEKLVAEHQVDPELYPDFSPALQDAMLEELVSFFHHILTSDRSFLDLIDSNYSFLNRELAAHYGIQGVDHDDFRLTYFEDDRRGGVLGMGSVLTVTSLPTRTSPVLRGKWVLEQLLGTPPPPPPPDVPELVAASDRSVNELDLRAILSQHREPSACYNCHQKMDPLGLGLENFDATGKWREQYGTVPIDASGVLPNGDAFTGPAELRQILMQEQRTFARNLSRKMLGYALGRTIRFQDKKTIDALTDTLLDTNFNSTEFLFTIINSYPFRYKKSDVISKDAE